VSVWRHSAGNLLPWVIPQGETFNFAEAALLIQGSAVIYSKKVEYLYQLVYETLDLLAARRYPKPPTCCQARTQFD
jgi:hypothetical protein